MAIDLGGIYVSFTGDTSKLEADIARAQALAKQGGADMSAAFNASAATAYKFSSAIDSVTAATQKLISAQRQLATASQASSAAAVEGTRKEEAELIALFDLEMDTAKAPTPAVQSPAAPTASTSAFAVDSAAITSITELGTASEASAVQVTALGAASTKAGLPVAELGFASKAASVFIREMGVSASVAAVPLAGIGAAAAASVAPLGAMSAAAVSPAVKTATTNATAMGAAVAGAGTAALKATPQIGAMTAAQQAAASRFATLAGNITAATVATNANTAAQAANATAAGRSVTQIQATSGALRVFEGNSGIRAAERFLTMLPGVGPLLQAAFPIVGAVALLEMFYRMAGGAEELKKSIEDLASATKDADDKFAHFVSTSDTLNVHAISRDLGPVEGAKAKANQLKMEAQDAKDEIGKLALQMIDLDKHGADLTRKGLGSAAARVLLPGVDSNAVKENNNNIQAIREKIQGLQAEILTKGKEAQSALEDASHTKTGETAETTLAGISNQIAANRRLAEAKRQAVENSLALDKQAEDAQIAGAESSAVRSIATAEQELQIAQQRAAKLKAIDDAELAAHIAMIRQKAAAESVGKDKQQVATVQTAARGEIDAAQADNARKQIELDARVAAAAAKVGQVRATVARESKTQLDELVRESENLLDRNTAQLTEATERLSELRTQANVRVEETQAKGGGELQQLQIQAQKLQLERQYGLEIGHTLSQQIAQETQLADLDSKGRAAKVAGLQTELDIAKAAQAEAAARSGTALLTGDTREATKAGEDEVRNKVKAADIQREINELRAQANNADIEAQIRIDQLRKQQGLRNQIKAGIGEGSFIDKTNTAAAHTVSSAVDGIASSLAKAAVQGGNLGRTLAQLGKSLAVSALTSILKAGLDAVLHSLLNLIPAFGAVKSAQTAAAAGAAAAQKAIAVASVTTAAGEGAAWAFESVIAAVPFPFNVALAPGVAAATFAQIIGFGAFAKGGRPVVGEPALIGEEGPELWIPDQAGTVVPAGKFSLAGATGLPGTSGLMGAAGLPSPVNLNLGSLGLPSQDAHFANTPPPAARNPVASDGTTIHLHGAQFHGVQNVRELMREIAQYSKTQSPRFSPYAR